jgi:hypothetical protein
MEDAITIKEGVSSADTQPSADAQPSVQPVSMASGGMADGGQKLGWVAIMMLGLASASLIYSIFYYKRRLEALKNGDNKMIAQLQADMQEMKSKIDTLTGKRTFNGRLV